MVGSAHTPGPWRVVSRVHGYSKVSRIAADGKADLLLGNQLDPKGVSIRESDANARLIAAAPELLEAAQYLAELYDHIWFDMSKVTDGEQQAMKRAWGHLEAAIAKATGDA